jgi:hypothetical protein
LKDLLEDDQVLCHPFVMGELACGSLRNRTKILGLFSALPVADVAEHADVLHLIESRQLHGRELGWIDDDPFGVTGFGQPASSSLAGIPHGDLV